MRATDSTSSNKTKYGRENRKTGNRGMRNPNMKKAGTNQSSSTSGKKKTYTDVAREVNQKYDKTKGQNSMIVRSQLEQKVSAAAPIIKNHVFEQAQRLTQSGYSFNAGGQFAGISKQAQKYIDQNNEPKTAVEAAQNAALRDTATDRRDYEYGKKYSYDQKLHENIIGWGNLVMTDQEAINDWILTGGSGVEGTPDQINERIDIVNNYFKDSLHYINVYDPEKDARMQGATVQQQFTLDAQLPPWIDPNTTNLDWWDYYKTYAHDVVESAHTAFKNASELERQKKLHPYTSAFATAEETGHVDSYLDVLVSSIETGKGLQSIPNTAANIVKNFHKYNMEYLANPLIVGYNMGTLGESAKTVLGNTVWNFMETSDIFRGTRALAAGVPELGGTHKTGHIFTDQDNEFWVSIDGLNEQDAKVAQQMFMNNGGRELIDKLRGNQLYGAAHSDEEIAARLEKAFNADAKLVKGVKWEDVYEAIKDQYFGNKDLVKESLKQGVENVKETYTNPDAKFEADTGNIAIDLATEMALDPSIVVGGMSKTIVKNSVDSAATNSMRKGFAAILRDTGQADELVRNKNIQRHIANFVSSNEGQNIIFKSAKDIDDDITAFIMKVGKENPNIFATKTAQDTFRRTVLRDLVGKNADVNATIIESLAGFRKRLDDKIVKAAFYMGNAFDDIDSAIVKTSFILPWAGVKGAKAGVNRFMNSKTVGKALARLNLKRSNAMKTLWNEKFGRIDVTNVVELYDSYKNGIYNEATIRETFQYAIDEYDNVAFEVNGIIRRFCKGEITDAEALRLVDEAINTITGGRCKNIDDLSGFIDSLEIRYRDSFAEAFKRLDNTVDRLKKVIDHRAEDRIEEFISKVRSTHDVNELGKLYREWMDNDYIMALKHEVVVNAPFDITYAEFDNLINSVRLGLFSEESVTKDLVQEATQSMVKASPKTVTRIVTFEDFTSMLDNMKIDWKKALSDINIEASSKELSTFDKKIAKFLEKWMENRDVTYNIDDVLRFVDRMERQVHFRQLMSPNTVSEASALIAHRDVGQFNALRRQLKKMDLISLKDVNYVVLPQLDRMALNLSFRNHKDIQTMYGSGFYDDVVAPIWNELKKKSVSDADIMESSLFIELDTLAKQKYGFDRTSQLIEQAKTLPGFSDEHLHSFLNTLATDFKFHDDLGNIDLSPGAVRRKMEATLRGQTGDSKVGMRNITDSLLSVDSNNPSEFIQPYMELFENEPELKSVFLKYAKKDVLDPSGYVEKQMLYTVLSDPSIIDDWNALAAKGQTPLMFHINTTGLNTEINSMTSVSFRQWKPINIPRTPEGNIDQDGLMRAVLDSLEKDKTVVFQRRMAEDEFSEITDQVMRSLDMKDCVTDTIKKRYKEFYGITKETPYKSERMMLEEACEYIRGFTSQVDEDGVLRAVAPTLVVHDLDGFNVKYFNNKVAAVADAFADDSPVADYTRRIARSAQLNSCNTYQRLADNAGDIYFTDEYIERITELVEDYVDDINHFANDYRFNDMQTYSRTLHDLMEYLTNKRETEQLTELESKFLKACEASDGANKLGLYDKAIQEITALGLYPRQYAFLSTGLEDNFTKEALKATGRDTVNVNSRLYIRDVLSYFDLEKEEGIYATIEDLKKMHNTAKYIRNARERYVVSGAESFLDPYKADFDRIIQSLKDIANGNSYDSISLSYLKDMKIPDNSIDSFLLARKLYNDHLKYWLDAGLLDGLHTSGKELDAAKINLENFRRLNSLKFEDSTYTLEQMKVYKQAVDFLNSNRVRLFDELTGGGFDVPRYRQIDELISDAQSQIDELNSASDQVFADLRIANAEAKEEMKALNKADWQEFKDFRKLVNDYFRPEYDKLRARELRFAEAKKEKWETYRRFKRFKENKQLEIDRLFESDNPDDWEKASELKREVKRANKKWQQYNARYMFGNFYNVQRHLVHTPYEFKDEVIAADYKAIKDELDELFTQFRRGEWDRLPSQKRAEKVARLKELEYIDRNFKSEASNHADINEWLEWSGDPMTYVDREILKDRKWRLLNRTYGKTGLAKPKKQPYLSRGRKATQKAIRNSARNVVRQTGLNRAEQKEFIQRVDDIAKFVSRNSHKIDRYEVLHFKLSELFNDIYRLDDEAYTLSKDLRSLLKNTSISSGLVKSDVADFSHFRKTHFGKYKITKSGKGIDSILEDIKDVAPDIYNDYYNKDYSKESVSDFFEFFDDYLENTRVKRIDIPDDEKEYLLEGLIDDILNELNNNRRYSVSDRVDAFEEAYDKFLRGGKTDYDTVDHLTTDRYVDYRLGVAERYEQAKLDSDMYKAEALVEYDNLKERLYQLNSNTIRDNVPEDVLDILQGAHEAEIFNYAARSDYEKRVLSIKDGVMRSGLSKATRYSEAGSQIRSNVRQLQYMDDYFASAGLLRKQDRNIGSMHLKAKQLFDILDHTGFLKRESFQTFIQKASELHKLQLQDYRFRALKNADGGFDENKLLSELVYNGFNMSVFNSHNYSIEDINQLRRFVKDLQKKYDFLSYYEDNMTGNVFIYLNNNCVVSEANNMRYINDTLSFTKPLHDVVPFAEFDDVAKLLDLEDIEDFRGVYAHLRSCWEDTRMLSLGGINGTTGKTVSRVQAEEFIRTLPSNMKDWLTSEGLLRDEIARDVVYDPGFVINEESDMLLDFLNTLNRQAEVAKDDAVIINEVFNKNGNIQFNELAEHFTDEELIAYFGENPEYVVCAIYEGEGTATGFAVKQLNLSNKAGLEIARTTPNTTILPYDAYYEIANYMNRSVNESVAKRLLGKYLLVYKAFALLKPGTILRNFVDATSKAAFDNNGMADDVFDMLHYEMNATKALGDYGRIVKTDPSLLTPANWDVIQRTYHTGMTYEDFELLRGVIDSTNYKSSDKYFLSQTAEKRGGFNVISGESIGLRNLEQEDISKAFDQYLSKEFDLPLSKHEFLDVYMRKAGGEQISDAVLDEQFEEMFRILSNNLRNGNITTMFDKTVDNMFKPFGTVEQIVRYAQAMKLRDNGFSTNQITRHIHNTQFYTAPVWGTWRKLETIIPFITFKMNNMMYWVRMMDENPRLFRYFADTYRSVYDVTLESALEEGVELDFANDYGLQSGALPFGNGYRYLNIGNSFLSAMGDFYGLPFDIDSLNPLLKTTIRGSAYTLGLNTSKFMNESEQQLSDLNKSLESIVPGLTLAKKGVKTFKDIQNVSSSSGGPTLDTLFSTLNFLGITGSRYQYKLNKSGRFSFDEWQEELEAQGKWYDANLGKIVDLSMKNEVGANDPNNSFQDVQAYMLVHFGKLWDANQHKFVILDEYQSGGYNNGFDSWEALQEYMALQGKVWDANQREFVYKKDYISGGLNAEGLEWETVVALMEEKFPNLKWDANQQTFVESRYYISGGLNDVKNFREVMGLRLALYGEAYDRVNHKFVATEEPSIVTMRDFMGANQKEYDDYYSLLGIPRLWSTYKKVHADSEGLLVTEDGKYILTGNPEHDAKVFDKFKNTFGYGSGGRRYHNYAYKNYGNLSPRAKKPYKGRSFGPTAYQTGYGWNPQYGYYREAFQYQYQYHSPQPGAKLNRLISPPVFYPYGGGYGKFSFYRH